MPRDSAFLIHFTLLCLLVWPAYAQTDAASPVDPSIALLEGYAPTPTDLTELIDPADASFGGYDYAMDMAGARGKSCYRRRLIVEESRWFFYRQTLLGDGLFMEVRDTFSLEGVCLETVFHRYTGDTVMTERAVLHENELQIEKEYPDQPPVQEVIPEYAPSTETVPLVWLELVFAYHIRMGHERFYLRGVGDAMRASTSFTVWLVDGLGTETVEVMGQEVEAYVFMIATYREVEGRPVQEPTPMDRRSLRYVMPNGTIVRTVRRGDDRVDIVTEAISIEDALARFPEVEEQGTSASSASDTEEAYE